MSGKHVIRQRKKAADQEDRGSSKEGSPFSTGSFNAFSSRPSPASDSTVSTLLRSPSPNRAEYVSTIVASVRADISTADVSGFLSWCELDKLGSKAVLDGAMCSLALHLVGKEKKDDDMIAQSRTIYGHSLGALQTSLQHATEWKASETLCAAMMLCIFEVSDSMYTPSNSRPVSEILSTDIAKAVCWDKLFGLLVDACQRYCNVDGTARTGCSRRRVGCFNDIGISWCAGKDFNLCNTLILHALRNND